MLPQGYDKTRVLRFLAWRPAEDPGMCEPVTAKIAPNAYCGHLLITIGLAASTPNWPASSTPPPHPWAIRGIR